MKTIKYLILSAILLISTGLLAEKHSFTKEQSKIKWTGKKVSGSHWGYINLKEGWLKMKDDRITGGVFTIDMTSISNEDLKSEDYNKKLVGHLSSDDFFGVEEHPESTLEIKESTPFENNEAHVKAHLTIKGITEPIEFKVRRMDHKLMASIVVDRSKFNVRYGSKSFFDNLGDKLIYDDFTLDVTLLLGHQ